MDTKPVGSTTAQAAVDDQISNTAETADMAGTTTTDTEVDIVGIIAEEVVSIWIRGMQGFMKAEGTVELAGMVEGGEAMGGQRTID